MALQLVSDTGAQSNLVDVPLILRNLAADIEQEGSPIPCCVTVVWYENGEIEIASAGMRSDQHDTHMLLTAAAQQLMQQTFSTV